MTKYVSTIYICPECSHENHDNYIYLQHLPLADCTMIRASSPIFTTIYARIFLKEAIVIADLINLVLVFVGIIFIVKPPFIFGHSSMYFEDPEAIYAIIAMLGISALTIPPIYIFLKMLKDVHWSVTLTVFSSFGFVESLIAVIIFTPFCLPESNVDRICLILIGVLSFFGQITFMMSVYIENAATVALLRNAFHVLFAFIFQIVFFQVSMISIN